MSNEKQLERALLWVIYEQCVYAGKAHARLLIHGQEAFATLGLQDGCNVEEIENKLFLNGDSTGKGVKCADDYQGCTANARITEIAKHPPGRNGLSDGLGNGNNP